jgi:hypothetical protein
MCVSIINQVAAVLNMSDNSGVAAAHIRRVRSENTKKKIKIDGRIMMQKCMLMASYRSLIMPFPYIPYTSFFPTISVFCRMISALKRGTSLG